MSDFLARINELTAARVRDAKARIPLAHLEKSPLYARLPAAAAPVFHAPGYHVIAEVKFASPSEGDIHPAAPEPARIAREYLGAGARMLSILTEPLYFKGSLEYLAAIRMEAPDALLLRKDFINDPYQLAEARACGADAVLLILAMTGESLTRDLLQASQGLGLSVLLEVHDEAELETAIKMGASLIGVNNRNLKTLKTDLETSRRLARHKPAGAVFICESGLSTPQNVMEMRRIGYDGFLMGTHFMRRADPGAALGDFMKELA